MQVEFIDGTTGVWNPHLLKRRDKQEEKSAPHLTARKLLLELYPTMQILEEVPVKISKTEYGFFDFYIPLLRLAIEVHGQQHYKFNSFFHATVRDFLWQKKRDQNKRYWCELNDINMIELDSSQDITQWTNQIKK